jgi:CHAD domain-containing protein
MRNLEGSLTGEIMESLHDLRTSARRIETIFDIFGAYFRPRKIDRQKEIFHSLVRSAGSVRECDVFIGMLDTMQREDDGPESVGINLLRARIVHQRNRNRPGLNRRLNMIGKKNFRRTFTDCITSMRLVYSNSDRLTTGTPDSFREAGREILPRLYRRFSKQLRIAIDHECTIKKLHDARLAGKPLRYSMEMFESVFGKKFKRALDNIRDLLRILGEIHDCDIAIAAIDQMLREIGIYNSFIRTDDRIFSVERLRHLLVDQQLKRRSLESELQPIAERWTSRAQRKRFGLALQ